MITSIISVILLTIITALVAVIANVLRHERSDKYIELETIRMLYEAQEEEARIERQGYLLSLKE